MEVLLRVSNVIAIFGFEGNFCYFDVSIGNFGLMEVTDWPRGEKCFNIIDGGTETT